MVKKKRKISEPAPLWCQTLLQSFGVLYAPNILFLSDIKTEQIYKTNKLRENYPIKIVSSEKQI